MVHSGQSFHVPQVRIRTSVDEDLDEVSDEIFDEVLAAPLDSATPVPSTTAA